jgi:regulator of ribonuclease activity A
MTSTADLPAVHGDAAQVCAIRLRSFGGVASFEGAIRTVRCLEDNVLLKELANDVGSFQSIGRNWIDEIDG